MRAGKPDFTMIEGEVLTIAIQLTSGTLADFGIVLPVRSCGGVTFRARCHGRPQTSLLWALATILLHSNLRIV